MKKLNISNSLQTAGVALLMFTTGMLAGTSSKPDHSPRPSILGAWTVDVQGAAYAPHLFVFLDNGVVLTTNPSRVQEKADGTGVNDSLGMGTWREKNGQIQGTFLQLNALQGTPTPDQTLIVAFRIKVSGNGNTFVGNAQAALSGNPTELFPATFTATRIKVNENMLAQVGGV